MMRFLKFIVDYKRDNYHIEKPLDISKAF